MLWGLGMVSKSIFEFLFLAERQRRRAAEGSGFSIPLMVELPLESGSDPILATNMSGDLVKVGRSKSRGVSRTALFPCDLSDEPEEFSRFFGRLWDFSGKAGWSNRCTSISEAVTFLKEPRTMVVSYELIREACGEDIDQETANSLMVQQGFLSEVNGIRVGVASLKSNEALVASAPKVVGTFVRVDTSIGILIKGADRTLVVVRT